MKPTCGIMIATHNRLDDLRKTLVEISLLQPAPAEVIICADACTDGTADFVRQSWPAYRLIVNDTSLGSIGSRDRMLREASSDILLSLDDDSHPAEPDFLQRVAEMFENDERLAVATFPQRSDEFPESLTLQDFGPSHFVGCYSSSGAAIRRSAFLELGGYPVEFYHAYEEPDFALRCVASGWHVRYETSLHVRHRYTSVERNEIRTHHFHARNELWSVALRCPLPYAAAVGVFRLLRQLNYARGRGGEWLSREPEWWWNCAKGLPGCLSRRKPVPWKHYRQWMELLHDPVFSQTKHAREYGSQTTA